MNYKELKAEISTIKKLTDRKDVIAVCDVLLDLAKTMAEKTDIGFKGKK